MASSTPIGSPSPTYTYERVDTKRKDTFISRCTEIYESKTWKPTALRAPVLILTIAICWSLIAVLEFFLWKSQKDSGIIFAPKISDLPLSKTFLYLYFPTIVAVIFSIFWAWIDLETKRMEPYYQLSKKDGALGKDSILLHYPFDFVPFVPLKAFRNRHWPVFWASLAIVLVTWGLVPTQAGIFTVKTVVRLQDVPFGISTYSMPFEQQATGLTLKYAQSTYGIATLNETLPPYMAHNYTLAPFAPATIREMSTVIGAYTAPTTMYSVELQCEDVSHKADNSRSISYASKNGCNYTLGLTGNLTIGVSPLGPHNLAHKEFTGMYVGYHNGGQADYYLSSDCPKDANSTFYAAFQKNKARPQDVPRDVTAIFCEPRYWRQKVSATIDIVTKAPKMVQPLGDRITLAWHEFNTTWFESMLNSGSLGVEVRGNNLPTTWIPDYLETMTRTNVSLTSGFGMIKPMVGLSVSIQARPLEDFLDFANLSKAYADSYRLMFARAMVEILGKDVRDAQSIVGQQQLVSEAVILVPVFVHVVVGLLSLVSIATFALLVIAFIRARNLRNDPSTIAGVMTLVADNAPLLSDFAAVDHCTIEDMQKFLGHKRYKLCNDDTGAHIIELPSTESEVFEHERLALMAQNTKGPTSIAKPVRPKEFSLWVACIFVNLFIILVVGLGVLYSKALVDGLPMPSTNTIVQNILENYIPTAIATLIEPMWILINRLLCILKPLEELQDCDAKAEKSIDLNYASLPPQLVIFKAIKSRHFVLAAVCTMALLANVLAVAFSGLINQAVVDIKYATSFQPPLELKFVTINGTIGPSITDTAGTADASAAYLGGNGEDQFLIADSNFSGTPLPPWTGDKMFYMPMFQENTVGVPNTTHYTGHTQSFGADLQCETVQFGKNFSASMKPYQGTTTSYVNPSFSMNISITSDSGQVMCYSGSASVRPGPVQEVNTCVTGPSSIEYISYLKPRENATQKERDVCMRSLLLGWMREPRGTCPLGKAINITVSSSNSMFIHCRPRLLTGNSKVDVDRLGRLRMPPEDTTFREISDSEALSMFTTGPVNLIGQSNLYLFKKLTYSWHNDSFASDNINYFASRVSNHTHLLDPNSPVPTIADVIEPLNNAYSKLFAIWLGLNKQKLLTPKESSAQSLQAISGFRIESEERVVLSTTMFIISEVILSIYVIVAIWVYMRRPGQYLARLPTSIAAVIALFAASAAVTDLQNTSHMGNKGRSQHLKCVDARYGYGSFVSGGDGKVHIGIEKTPFVRKRTRTTWLHQKLPLFRKRTCD